MGNPSSKSVRSQHRMAVPLRWQKGPRTAVFDLDSEDDVERLGRILVDGDAFDADVRP